MQASCQSAYHCLLDNMGYILPPFTTFRDETHTTVYYRIKVGTLYHAEEFVDLRWYIIKDLGARINYQ